MGITVTGVEETAARLRAVGDRALDGRAFWAREAEVLEGVIDQSWATRTSPAGDRWPDDKDGRSDSRGRLRRAHSVTGTARGLSLRVALRHAVYQFFGTRRVPARNPLPFEPAGAGQYVVPMRGRAAVWWRGLQERFQAYLESGASS